MFERERETMFTTNSPVSSTLLNVSLSEPPPSRGPTLMQSIGVWPSFQSNENHDSIELRALLTQQGMGLRLVKARP